MAIPQHQLIDRAVNLAVERVISKGPDDVFRPPSFSQSLEIDVIARNADEFRAEATRRAKRFLNQDSFNANNIGPLYKVQTVKDEYSVRHCTWLDPFDAVSYLALANIMFESIEQKRPNRDLNIVHSHRMGVESNIFDEDFGYNSFRKASSELSNKYIGKWKVITDISNFFDRIGNHALENALESIGVEKKYAKLTKDLLLHWSEGRRSFGVPVGGDASRIISEAALIDVDNYLVRNGVTFLRYVDDYRIFTDTKGEALKALSILTDALYAEGLFLNSKKTNVIKIVNPDHITEALMNDDDSVHDPINFDERIEIRRAVRVSGRSSISRHYKEPGKEALEKLQKIAKEDILKSIAYNEHNDFERNVKQAVKYFLYVDQDIRILEALIDEKITTIFYIVDALLKESEKFTDEQRLSIKNSIINAVDWINGSYPIQMAIVRFLGSEPYGDKDYINTSIENFKAMDSKIFFKELISMGYRQISVGNLRNLAINVFNSVPPFVQRSIYDAVLKHPSISEEQRNPLIKNLKAGNQDWYIARMG